MKSPTTLVAFWDVDAPATLERAAANPRDPFVTLIPLYDFIFTYGGGDPVVRGYRALGARDCFPIYSALDPKTHHPVPPDKRFACDLGFLGNRLPDREARVEEFFLGAAVQSPSRTFLLGGAGWGDKHRPTAIPGGEIMLEVQTRMVREMDRMCELHPESHVAIFSHADVIKAAVAHFAGIPLDLFHRLEISPASISVIALDKYGPRILRVNHPGEE
jgi:hypothetical protein